jgi:N-acyl amino acid synthase of PEP-CTERM/exosortase system
MRQNLCGRCYECGFIKEDDHPNKLDIDEHDTQSVHFAAIDTDGEVIGSLRMILPGELPLPIDKYCKDGLEFAGKNDPNCKAIELSRFVISKRIRRRKDDDLYYGPQVANGNNPAAAAMDKAEASRRSKPMAFGLYRAMYLESKARGITHWYTLMENGLWLLLWVHGFEFDCIGPELECMGKVKPYVGDISRIEKKVAQKFPKFFEYFTKENQEAHLNGNS